MYPAYPTVPTAYVFQKFANINWQMYGRKKGKQMGLDLGIVSGLPSADLCCEFINNPPKEGK